MDSVTGRGNVTVELVTNQGIRSTIADDHNTLLYKCADAAAKLFAGQIGKPTHIGFVCGSSNTQGTEFAFNGERDKTQLDIVTGSLVVKDVLLAPNPRIEVSDSTKYSGNKVVFNTMTTDNTEQEYVYGFLLKDGAGSNANVLAVMRLQSPAVHPVGYAVSATWAVTFN